MSSKKKFDWMRKRLYKDLLKDHNELNKKKYLKKQADQMSNNMTAPEKKIAKILTKMGIEFESQKIVNEFIYDFYIPEYNLLIEVDGDYYHGNPTVYQEGELNNMQKKNKKKDVDKSYLAKGLGYSLERFWEKDINENIGQIKKTLKKYVDGK